MTNTAVLFKKLGLLTLYEHLGHSLVNVEPVLLKFFFFFFNFILFFFSLISVLLFLIFFFIQDFQQVTAQHSVQWPSLPRDFLRAWWLINCSFLLIFFMNFLCCRVVVCIDLFCFCFCLSSSCVQCCQFLWIVHSWLLFGFL